MPINAILNCQQMVEILGVQSIWLPCVGLGGADMLSPERVQDASPQKERLSIVEVTFFLRGLERVIRSNFERGFAAYFCSCFFVPLHQGAY